MSLIPRQSSAAHCAENNLSHCPRRLLSSFRSWLLRQNCETKCLFAERLDSQLWSVADQRIVRSHLAKALLLVTGHNFLYHYLM